MCRFVCVYVCVWLCVCMCMCMCVSVYICLYVCVRVYECTCVRVYVCTCVRVYMCMCVCVYVSVIVCMCLYFHYFQCLPGWVNRRRKTAKFIFLLKLGTFQIQGVMWANSPNRVNHKSFSYKFSYNKIKKLPNLPLQCAPIPNGGCNLGSSIYRRMAPTHD